MNKYIDADKLIAEIERRIDSWSIRGEHSPAGQGKDTCERRVTELSDLLSFITSLQQEQPDFPPINPDDAMKKLDEKIALVKERGTWKGVDVDKFMDEVRGREPVCEELEDAAKKSARKEFRRPYSDTPDEPIVIIEPDHYEGFIAGANWQENKDQETIKLAEDHAYLAGAVNEREKMIKEAVEGEIVKDNRGNNVVRAGAFNKDFEYGDKVRVIVVKDGEK